jgi:large subunit ribosomal protein L13
MRTYSTKASDIRREWVIVDASDKTLGRLATEVAILLRGKHKPIYTPHLDVGDHVIVLNAAKVKVTGDKLDQKIYYRHSQYPGGLKSTSLKRMMETYPTRVIEHAVRGMLPHNRLGAAMFRKLKVYPGAEHPHQSQVKATSKES